MLSALCAMLSLYVAGQTVIGHFALCMTTHAPIHGHPNPRLRRRSFALADISVAIFTIHLSQHDMTAVREEDMVRLCVKAFPWNFFSSLLKLPDLFLFQTLRNGFFMTFHAGGDAGHSREGLRLEIRVAGVTSQALFEMLLMVE
jgi:hypothetical protein